ncbi:hypothetical protein [Evansella tamaricis]|uniref:Uncharacterized protein n=1 Tax=Evansella tamaricis TaxID=2069301 RepID=A0ABS6JFL2_9BACI|nr:hypothetical protein [Evansella tamaricis]MBU9712185.1 hypothetical protein [Evansella tamaricis]
MNPIYLFLLASIIAVIGLVILFKRLGLSMEDKLEKGEDVTQESFQRETNRFFMMAPLVEMIPILLVVLAFMQMEGWAGELTQDDIVFPIVIVVIIWFFGGLNVFLTRKRILMATDVKSNSKNYINTLSFISFALIGSLPVISIVGLILFTA